MAHKSMPNYRLERLSMRRNVLWILDGHLDDDVAMQRRMASIWPDDAIDLTWEGADGCDYRQADSRSAAAYREYDQGIIFIGIGEEAIEDRMPALVVCPSCQFCDVAEGECIDITELSEVSRHVDRIRHAAA